LLPPGAPTAAALERSNPELTFARTSHAYGNRLKAKFFTSTAS
jgi:hypothetical protein